MINTTNAFSQPVINPGTRRFLLLLFSLLAPADLLLFPLLYHQATSDSFVQTFHD